MTRVLAVCLLLGLGGPTLAEDWSVKGPPPPCWRGEGVVKTPKSSAVQPGEPAGTNHTNTKVFVPVYGPCDDKTPVKDGAPPPSSK